MESIQVSTDGANPTYLAGSQLSGGNAVLAVLGGTQITADATWENFGASYILLEANLTVPVGYTMVVSPTAALTVKFNPSVNVYVAGTLNVLGTSKQKVTLTTANATPAAGQWGGIGFQPGSAGTSPTTTIQYGGYYIIGHSSGTYYASLLDRGRQSQYHVTLRSRIAMAAALRSAAAPRHL